jgi:hypothetical protein
MIYPLDKITKVSFPTVEQKQKFKSNPWKVAENDFPINSTTSEQLKFLLNYAILAPSSHNTQPWRFKIVDDTIELYTDKTRALPIADPNYRELIISCGAALFNLRIAIRHFGYRDIVEILPDYNSPDLLARISLGSKRIIKFEENFLFGAISKRCTNRNTFDDCQLPNLLISELEAAARSEGSWLQIITEVISHTDRQAVIDLIAEGDRLQMANPSFRQELARWIRNNRCDGIPAHAQGINQNLDAVAPLISLAVRTFDLGKSQSAKDCKLASQAPVLLLLSSNDDNPQAWLETGEALGHLLLRARIDDVWASFFNQPIQIPLLRSRLQELFPDNGYPQLLLRLGYAKATTPTPRRTVDKVLNEIGS